MKTQRLRIITLTTCTLLMTGLFARAAVPTWTTWTVESGGNGHSYLAVPESPGLTWNVANQLAQAQGGYLATITSAEENAFIYGLINDPAFFTGFNGSGPAIGGLQLPGSSEPAGGWVWATGEAWVYSNWGPGLPNGVSENRLHFFSGIGNQPSPQWNDLGENDSNIGGYIIEVPEPASFAILGAGLLLVELSRRRKQGAA